MERPLAILLSAPQLLWVVQKRRRRRRLQSSDCCGASHQALVGAVPEGPHRQRRHPLRRYGCGRHEGKAMRRHGARTTDCSSTTFFFLETSGVVSVFQWFLFFVCLFPRQRSKCSLPASEFFFWVQTCIPYFFEVLVLRSKRNAIYNKQNNKHILKAACL